MRLTMLVLGMAACTGKLPTTSTVDTGTDTDTDTGMPPVDSADSGTPPTQYACPPEIVPLAIEVCAETTQPNNLTNVFEISGTAMLTEVGAALDPVPGSAPLYYHDACDSSFPNQVRLVDDVGDIWTFGWEIEGDIDEDSTKALLTGTDLGFYVALDLSPFYSNGALLLYDVVGPVILYERGGLLSEEQRGMIMDSTDLYCLVSMDEFTLEHFGVTYAWAEGSVTLQSGQATTIPLPGRELSLLQGSAYTVWACVDGCTLEESMGWAEAP